MNCCGPDRAQPSPRSPCLDGVSRVAAGPPGPVTAVGHSSSADRADSARGQQFQNRRAEHFGGEQLGAFEIEVNAVGSAVAAVMA